jgi:hypothetical protein
LKLNNSVIITTQKDRRFVAVKEFLGPDADRKINILQQIRHKNFLAFLECFNLKGSCFTVFKYEITKEKKLSVTLNHYALIAHYLTEPQLAIILKQVSLLMPI